MCTLTRLPFRLCPTSTWRANSRHTGPHIIAPAGGKHFIGWELRDTKGDAAFAVIRCTVFDDLKVIERFPLTEDGWRQAWQPWER